MAQCNYKVNRCKEDCEKEPAKRALTEGSTRGRDPHIISERCEAECTKEKAGCNGYGVTMAQCNYRVNRCKEDCEKEPAKRALTEGGTRGRDPHIISERCEGECTK